jgi:hypothetical protein
MQLPLSGDGFRGTIRGFAVKAFRSSRTKAAQVKIVVAGNGADTEIPATLGISGHRLFDRGDQLVGDPVFDARYRIQGDPATVMAVFDAETRNVFMRHPAETAPFTVENGELSLVVPDRTADGADVIVEATAGALRLAERLPLRGRDVPAVLLQNARQDPLREVRVRNLEILADARVRDARLLDHLRRMAGEDDPAVRLHAARGLGAEGFATLARLVTSPATPPEVAARALTVVSAPPGFAPALFAPPAEVVPLIRHAVTAASWELRVAGLYALAGQAEAAAARGERRDDLCAADLERAALAALGSDAEETLQAAVAALAAIGAADAVLPLRALVERKRFSFGLGTSAGEAVARIQGRLHGRAAAGRVVLAPAGDAAGRVGLAGDDRAGRISLAPPDRDKVRGPTRNGRAEEDG